MDNEKTNIQLVIGRDDLNAMITEAVRQGIADHLEALQHTKEADALVEQHVAAAMLKKHVATLARWAKAGRIERVDDTLGREVYYRMADIQRLRDAISAKKALSKGGSTDV